MPTFIFMKSFKLVIILIMGPLSCFCQRAYLGEPEEKLQTLEKNIFRIIFTSPLSANRETNTFAFNYERQLQGAFCLDSKIGLGVGINKFGSSKSPNQYSFHGFGSIEGKYYLFLKQRKKGGKYIYNFTSPYISLEQNLFTNALALINQVEKEAFEGATATFINLGYQAQSSKLYLRAFFGVQILYSDFAKYDANRSLRVVHGGASIGYVF